jgi:inner membrane protein
MKSVKTNLYFKVAIIIFIALLLMIPTAMIDNLISDREETQTEAIEEVSDKWAKQQTISGPFLSIPFYRYVKETNAKDNTEKIVKFKEYLHILPTDLKINSKVKPEHRYRGIYEIVVYNSKTTISGTFSNLDVSKFDIPVKDLLIDKANICVGIDDLRGIEKQINLNWNQEQFSFNPGVITNDVVESGINATVQLDPTMDHNYTFSFDLDLKGSQLLYFTPVGKISDISIESPWKNPSFNGAFLPDSRKISNEGFSANWNVLHLNRNYPQSWIGNKHNIGESAFGVDLLLPIDNYQKSYRCIRYAILFIGFTFLVFFFIEILNKKFIHPIQYILVGFGLLVFYTLLLSISEYLNFNYAFIIAAIATLILNIGYVKAILKSSKLAYFIGAMLFILYAFIFIIIQLQDLALLIGSIGIFIILGLVMYYSRKIDWYNLNGLEENIEQ